MTRLRQGLFEASAPRSVILIRLLVGCVFFSEGVQKFLFPAALGVGRFQRIGIPDPQFFGPFVGVVEIVCGALVMVGLVTRLASIPLLMNISVAIATTKIPMFAKSGLWATLHEARTDFCMFLGSTFLIVWGSGGLSLDRMLDSSDASPGTSFERDARS
jgi:putative oxidoreductase